MSFIENPVQRVTRRWVMKDSNKDITIDYPVVLGLRKKVLKKR